MEEIRFTDFEDDRETQYSRYKDQFLNRPLKDWFNEWTEIHPDKAYVIFDEFKLSYEDINCMARRLANALLELGIRKGDLLTIIAPNIPEFVISCQACFKIAAVIAKANPLYNITEFTAHLNQSGSETVIVTACQAHTIIEILKSGTTKLKRIIVVQLPGENINIEENKHIYDFYDLISAADDREPKIAVHINDPQMIQTIIKSSGGLKHCCISNIGLLTQAMLTSNWFKPAVSPEKMRTLGSTPFYDTYGYICNINVCLYGGGTIILVPQPDSNHLLEAINKHQPNIWATIPAMLMGVNNHPDIAKSKIDSIKAVFSAFVPLAADSLRKFEIVTRGRILEGYARWENSRDKYIDNIAGMDEGGFVYLVNSSK